jgi:hypothetical protein
MDAAVDLCMWEEVDGWKWARKGITKLENKI